MAYGSVKKMAKFIYYIYILLTGVNRTDFFVGLSIYKDSGQVSSYNAQGHSVSSTQMLHTHINIHLRLSISGIV